MTQQPDHARDTSPTEMVKRGWRCPHGHNRLYCWLRRKYQRVYRFDAVDALIWMTIFLVIAVIAGLIGMWKPIFSPSVFGNIGQWLTVLSLVVVFVSMVQTERARHEEKRRQEMERQDRRRGERRHEREQKTIEERKRLERAAQDQALQDEIVHEFYLVPGMLRGVDGVPISAIRVRGYQEDRPVIRETNPSGAHANHHLNEPSDADLVEFDAWGGTFRCVDLDQPSFRRTQEVDPGIYEAEAKYPYIYHFNAGGE